MRRLAASRTKADNYTLEYLQAHNSQSGNHARMARAEHKKLMKGKPAGMREKDWLNYILGG